MLQKMIVIANNQTDLALPDRDEDAGKDQYDKTQLSKNSLPAHHPTFYEGTKKTISCQRCCARR
jgi:hypothetical protein